MSALSIATDIISFAEESFPEFFAAISDSEKKQLTEIAERMIGFGLQYPLADTPDQLAIKVAVMREYSIFRLMILDRMIAERKHNTERVFSFIGKAVAVIAAAIPVALAATAEGAAEAI